MSKSTAPNVDTMNFTISPATANVMTSTSLLTDSGGWVINLGWSPASLSANSQNNLNLVFLDAFTEKKIVSDVSYDLRILDSEGNSLISKTDLVGKGGKDTQSITLPSQGEYSIQVNVKSIVNNGLADTSRTGLARGNLVIPSVVSQETVPEFPSTAMWILVIGFASILMLSRIKRRI